MIETLITVFVFGFLGAVAGSLLGFLMFHAGRKR